MAIKPVATQIPKGYKIYTPINPQEAPAQEGGLGRRIHQSDIPPRTIKSRHLEENIHFDGATIGTDGTTGLVTISKAGVITLTGASGITIPHLMQSDSTDQAIANVSNAQIITFDTDVHHKDIIRTSSSRFTIQFAGSYLLTFSGVAVSSVANKIIEVWLRKNGVDVAASNTIYTFKTTNATAVVAVSFIEHFAVGEYFEFWTWGNDTGAKWDATAAGSTPTRPACPSIIITANYISYD